jgi:hypothetical protein
MKPINYPPDWPPWRDEWQYDPPRTRLEAMARSAPMPRMRESEKINVKNLNPKLN